MSSFYSLENKRKSSPQSVCEIYHYRPGVVALHKVPAVTVETAETLRVLYAKLPKMAENRAIMPLTCICDHAIL